MNKKGFGIALILTLITALLIAFLAVKNTDSLGIGSGSASQQENYVQQAHSLVDQINQKQQTEQEH